MERDQALSLERDIVYIGTKPPMSYVVAVLMCLSSTGTATIKARGRAITTAVDVAEITRRRFRENAALSKINIGTEEMPTEGGGARNVSTIEITITTEALPQGTTPTPPKQVEPHIPEPEAPVEVGKEYQVDIVEVSRRGEGVAKVQGFIIFIPGAKPGEHPKVRVTKVARSFASGEIAG
jgi:DNA-binding protein